MIRDLTGLVMTELLANAAVAAIVGAKVRSEFGLNEGPPAVIVEQLGINYNPGGGTRRLRLQASLFAAKTYGVTRVQAAQLANAVVEAVELRGPRKDASGRLVWLSLVESGGDVILDPVTRWPHATITFTYLGAQQTAALP